MQILMALAVFFLTLLPAQADLVRDDIEIRSQQAADFWTVVLLGLAISAAAIAVGFWLRRRKRI